MTDDERDTCFLAACKSGHNVGLVSAALDAGASINAMESSGRTGLLLACARRNWEIAKPIVELLLKKRSLANVPGQLPPFFRCVR
jgi:ankyrin repeat protein